MIAAAVRTPFSKMMAYLLRLVPMSARLLMLVLAGVVTALIVTVFKDGVHTVEERIGALGWTLSADSSVEQRISIIAIDEQSLAQEGPWPWSRATMAQLVTALNDYGVQLQLLDIVFPENAADDEALASALSASRGAVLAQVPVLETSQTLRTGLMTHALSGIGCTNSIPAASNFLANNSSFAAVPKGHIAPIVDADGAIHA